MKPPRKDTRRRPSPTQKRQPGRGESAEAARSRIEAMLDEGLEESFPASDPLSIAPDPD